MSDELNTWLREESDRHGWSFRKLAKKAGISPALISRVLSGDLEASADFCIAVAHAFEVPPENVLRIAGLLPASDDSTVQEIVDIVKNLPAEEREEVLKYARFRYGQRKE